TTVTRFNSGARRVTRCNVIRSMGCLRTHPSRKHKELSPSKWEVYTRPTNKDTLPAANIRRREHTSRKITPTVKGVLPRKGALLRCVPVFMLTGRRRHRGQGRSYLGTRQGSFGVASAGHWRKRGGLRSHRTGYKVGNQMCAMCGSRTTDRDSNICDRCATAFD